MAGLIRLLVIPAALAIALGTAALVPATANAANETVNIWLTSTNDSAGRSVTRGLQQQAPISFAAGNASSGQNITVNENTKFQQFVGAGATMTKLFDPNNGIGVDFLRNPMGASDLARFNYSYDDMPAGQTDPNLTHFSIGFDQTDILPLTKQAEQMNPGLKLMMNPWSAPGWMKADGNFDNHSFLQSQFYAAYAQYYVKTIQAYQAQGVHVDYVSAQNEPGCCSGANYPTMAWN